MAQLNMHVTEEFAEQLEELMRLRGFATKSEAIRAAVQEGVERARATCAGPGDFAAWIGEGLAAATNPRPRFRSDADLWA